MKLTIWREERKTSWEETRSSTWSQASQRAETNHNMIYSPSIPIICPVPRVTARSKGWSTGRWNSVLVRSTSNFLVTAFRALCLCRGIRRWNTYIPWSRSLAGMPYRYLVNTILGFQWALINNAEAFAKVLGMRGSVMRLLELAGAKTPKTTDFDSCKVQSCYQMTQFPPYISLSPLAS
jgi:hypothetical protein